MNKKYQNNINMIKNNIVLEIKEINKPKYIKPIIAQKTGYVSKIDTFKIGMNLIEIGAGRKGKDLLKEFGPLMQSIFDRRFANAIDGELFPNIGTKDISNALNTHVFPKIPKEVTAHLKT